MLSVSNQTPPIGFQLIDDDHPTAIASICAAHGIATESQQYAQLTTDAPGLRMRLLAGILRCADILEEVTSPGCTGTRGKPQPGRLNLTFTGGVTTTRMTSNSIKPTGPSHYGSSFLQSGARNSHVSSLSFKSPRYAQSWRGITKCSLLTILHGLFVLACTNRHTKPSRNSQNRCCARCC